MKLVMSLFVLKIGELTSFLIPTNFCLIKEIGDHIPLSMDHFLQLFFMK